MAIISGATKRGQTLLARASEWDGTYLSDVYGSWSGAKERAWRECYEKCNAVNGTNFHICSHNGWAFSVAWEFINQETGEVMTQIETSSGTYIIDGSRRKEKNDEN